MDNLERITWLRPQTLHGTEFLSITNNTSPFTAFHERYVVGAGIGGRAA